MVCLSRGRADSRWPITKNNDPLVTALSKTVTVNTLTAPMHHPHPICVLGEVNDTRGFWPNQTMTAVAGVYIKVYQDFPVSTVAARRNSPATR